MAVTSLKVPEYRPCCSLGISDRREASCRSKTKSLTESGKRLSPILPFKSKSFQRLSNGAVWGEIPGGLPGARLIASSHQSRYFSASLAQQVWVGRAGAGRGENGDRVMVRVERRSSVATGRRPTVRCGSGLAPRILCAAAICLYLVIVPVYLVVNFAGPARRVAPGGVGGGAAGAAKPSSKVASVRDEGETFTPEEFKAGRMGNYVNRPLVVDPSRDVEVDLLAGALVPPPAEDLLHRAPAPPGNNAIVGLASYATFMTGFRRLVGSLRVGGYDGHIILGVHPDIPQKEESYLTKMGVTMYKVVTAECDPRILDGVAETSNGVRAKCSRGLEDLKLEWGRYEMARRWLRACEGCTGWSMVIDTRDIFFQADPFSGLGDPNVAEHDLLFVEEIAKYTNPKPHEAHRAVDIGESRRFVSHVLPCYGSDAVRPGDLADRPMLCSGTVLGTRDGMHRFLSVLVDEFQTNNGRGAKCRSPATTDQWTMNHLYYSGRFGRVERTRTVPWGTGPVLTVGKPCVNSKDEENKSGKKDLMALDGDGDGLVLNRYESEESPTRVAPALHQWDRCAAWINPWFKAHRELYMRADEAEDEPPVPWVG